MPKYIDANALKELLKHSAKSTKGIGASNDVLKCFAYCINKIDTAPTADAAKVRHGRWEITDAYPHWMCCSVCHKAVVRNIEVIERYEIPTSFCPSCGAMMEGKP